MGSGSTKGSRLKQTHETSVLVNTSHHVETPSITSLMKELLMERKCILMQS